MKEPPTEHVKSVGLPGHWVVVRPDGRMFGRVATDHWEQQFGHDKRFSGVSVDAGAKIEYEIAPTWGAWETELQSRHKTFTHAQGLASYEDPRGLQKVTIC